MLRNPLWAVLPETRCGQLSIPLPRSLDRCVEREIGIILQSTGNPMMILSGAVARGTRTTQFGEGTGLRKIHSNGQRKM